MLESTFHSGWHCECSSEAEPSLLHQACVSFLVMLRMFRLKLGPQGGSCAWWPGRCSTGGERRRRSGRCRPPCCRRLGGWAELPWSWRASRCDRSHRLTSDCSETESGNTCRTEKDMMQHTSSNWEFLNTSKVDWPLFDCRRDTCDAGKQVRVWLGSNHALLYLHVVPLKRSKWSPDGFSWQRRWCLTFTG